MTYTFLNNYSNKTLKEIRNVKINMNYIKIYMYVVKNS